MTLEQFKRLAKFSELYEIDRTCYLAFFYLKTKSIQSFTAAEAASWLINAGGAAPNKSRLVEKITSSRSTVKANNGWRLTDAFVQQLESKFPQLLEKSQDIVDDGTILPEIDYANTRRYIEALARQINASYERNIFDGCAVLMRRLLEVLLILSYRHLNIEAKIQDGNGNYKMLEAIVNDAKNNGVLSLSRNSKGSLDVFRELGNFSAHKIEYLCRREYITPHVPEYRALIVELLYKCGLR